MPYITDLNLKPINMLVGLVNYKNGTDFTEKTLKISQNPVALSGTSIRNTELVINFKNDQRVVEEFPIYYNRVHLSVLFSLVGCIVKSIPIKHSVVDEKKLFRDIKKRYGIRMDTEFFETSIVENTTYITATADNVAYVGSIIVYANPPLNVSLLDTFISWYSDLKNSYVEVGPMTAVGPSPVDLKTAGDFALLTKTGITDTSPHRSEIIGNVGASPITAAAILITSSEMSPGSIIYGADANYPDVTATNFKGSAADNQYVAQAILDMQAAYADAASRVNPDFTNLKAGQLGGLALEPGLYRFNSSVVINSDLTLLGGPDDVWIFQIAGSIIQASNTTIHLTGGAVTQNIFWQTAGGAIINTDSDFKGTILAATACTIKVKASVSGRILTQTAVTLEENKITQPQFFM